MKRSNVLLAAAVLIVLAVLVLLAAAAMKKNKEERDEVIQALAENMQVETEAIPEANKEEEKISEGAENTEAELTDSGAENSDFEQGSNGGEIKVGALDDAEDPSLLYPQAMKQAVPRSMWQISARMKWGR